MRIDEAVNKYSPDILLTKKKEIIRYIVRKYRNITYVHVRKSQLIARSEFSN